MVNWGKMYEETEKVFEDIKGDIEEEYPTLEVIIDRRELKLSDEVPIEYISLGNFPPRIAIKFYGEPMRNIYGSEILDRIKVCWGTFIGRVAERYAMRAKSLGFGWYHLSLNPSEY